MEGCPGLLLQAKVQLFTNSACTRIDVNLNPYLVIVFFFFFFFIMCILCLLFSSFLRKVLKIPTWYHRLCSIFWLSDSNTMYQLDPVFVCWSLSMSWSAQRCHQCLSELSLVCVFVCVIHFPTHLRKCVFTESCLLCQLHLSPSRKWVTEIRSKLHRYLGGGGTGHHYIPVLMFCVIKREKKNVLFVAMYETDDAE